MKPQILFVDDEPSVLAAIRRLLRKHGQEWEVRLAGGAVEALRILDEQRIDVLVTDMRMPCTDGVTLLEQARRRHPATARVVLSGDAERQAILAAAGPTQQFLTKPCDPEVLERVLASVIGTVQLMDDPQLRALIGAQESLPKPPGLYTQLTALTSSPETTVKDVARLIEQDVATSAEVLKLVNSSFFGLASDVTSIDRAVSLLGLDVIQALVLAGTLFTSVQRLPDGLDARAISVHGLAACLQARRIAELESWDPTTVAQLGLAALLHDVGLLVLAAGHPAAWSRYQQQRCQQPDRSAGELQADAFGCAVGRASAYLLGLWGFAAPIVAVLANQPLDLTDPAALAAASPSELAIAYAHNPTTATCPGSPTHSYLHPDRINRWTTP